jgi:ankyrin repeat protein
MKNRTKQSAFLVLLILSFSTAAVLFTIAKTLSDKLSKITLEQALISAAQENHLITAKKILKLGINPNTADSKGKTPLMFAAANGHLKMAELLLQYNSKINAKDNNGLTPLSDAAAQGHLSIVRFLIKHGADINVRTPDGGTPLIIAAIADHPKIVKFLIQKGANLNIMHNMTYDPDVPSTALVDSLHENHLQIARLLLNAASINVNLGSWWCKNSVFLAVEDHSYNIVKQLVQKGAHVNYRGSCATFGGHTALDVAAERGYYRISKLLLHSKADPNNQVGTWLNNTPLIFATENQHPKIIKLLLNYGANPNIENLNRQTPLSIAEQKGYKQIVNILLNGNASQKLVLEAELVNAIKNGNYNTVNHLLISGVNPNSKSSGENIDEGSPLMYAAKAGHKKIVKLLLLKGAKINTQDQNRNTALTYAIQYNHPQITKLLLANHAKISWKDFMAAYMYATYPSDKFIKLLLKKKKKPSTFEIRYALLAAVRAKDCALVKKLLNKALLNQSGLNWIFANAASISNNNKIINLLLAKGANINSKSELPNLIGSLEQLGNSKLTQLLIRKGLEVNAADSNGNTLLMEYAGVLDSWYPSIHPDPLSIVKLLLQKGAKVNIQNIFGETALMDAALSGNKPAVKLLIESGANLNLKDKKGETALNYAEKGHHPHTAALLKQYGGN